MITTTIATRAVLAGCLAAAVAVTVAHTTWAQGRGGGGGGADGPMVLELSRLETLAQGFKFTRDQKPKVKAILDQAHTSAAPIRDALTKTRAAIAAAIQAEKPQAEIDSAVKDYAAQVAAMTDVEVKALADVMMLFTPEQRANTAAVSTAFFMFRGIFIEKKWDIVANGFYGY